MKRENIELSKSALFVLPMLSRRAATIGLNGNFKNCYIGIDKYPELDNHIILHYKYGTDKVYREMEQKLQEIPTYERTLDIGDDVLYVYKVPELYQRDYDLFKQGKYSEFSIETPNYKRLILRVWDLVVQEPGSDEFKLIETAHSLKIINVIFPVLVREVELKKVLEYNLSNDTKGNIYLDSNTSDYPLSQVTIPEENELYSIPDEQEIFKYQIVRYPKSAIRINKEFE